LAAAEAALRAAQDGYQQLLDGPDDEIAVAKADLEKAEVALKQAQTEYANTRRDRVSKPVLRQQRFIRLPLAASGRSPTTG
jgi:multidrug efflux pump subunit AcrA (membrane-fusion protein)